MKQEHKDLKAMAVCTLIAILVTPIVYNFLFIPFGWWLR